MPVKNLILFIFLFSCNENLDSNPDVAIDLLVEDSKKDLLTVTLNCESDFSSCQATAQLKIGQNDNVPRFFLASHHTDGTALGFNFEGEAETLEGDVILADASKGRPFPPLAGLVEPRENEEITEIVWDSLGDTIQVSFPRPDFIKVTYDVGLIDRLDLDRPHRRIKGEFTTPISVRCYTGVPGSGSGVRDSDFSSEFCKKYEKHNHQFSQ